MDLQTTGDTDTTKLPSAVIADMHAELKPLAYQLNGHQPSELAAVIVNLQELLNRCGFILEQAANAIARTDGMEFDDYMAGFDMNAAKNDISQAVKQARVHIAQACTEIDLAFTVANHLRAETPAR
jgi:hypothetical protein